MQNSSVKRVHEYWHSIRPNGGLPHRSDFSPADITECLPYLFILERKQQDEGEPDYLVRLIGTQLVEHFGADPTGRSVFEVLAPEAVEFFKVFYGHLLGQPTGAVLYFTQSFGREKESGMEFLYLPMILGEAASDADLILCAAGMLDDEVQLKDMGGRWESPTMLSGGWLDLGFGKPDDPFLQNVCAAVGAEYLEL